MLVQYCWLSSLPFIASAIAHAYPPAGLRPRSLTTGTGISLPSTSAPPYPTGTAVPTGSITTSTATPTSTPSSEFFYLVVADTGTQYDGDFLTISSQSSGTGLLVLYPRAQAPDEVTLFSTFNINADGTLQNEFARGIANIFPGTDGTLFFRDEAYVDAAGNIKSICEVVGGTLTCQTGADTVFFICPFQRIAGTLVDGTVNVGPTVRPGCTPITLLVVPV